MGLSPATEGLLACAALGLGGWLLARSTRQLRRRGVHRAAFWATLGQHGRYRLRALPSAGSALLALALVAFGLYSAYQAVLAFYAERFGRIGTGG